MWGFYSSICTIALVTGFNLWSNVSSQALMPENIVWELLKVYLDHNQKTGFDPDTYEETNWSYK